MSSPHEDFAESAERMALVFDVFPQMPAVDGFVTIVHAGVEDDDEPEGSVALFQCHHRLEPEHLIVLLLQMAKDIGDDIGVRIGVMNSQELEEAVKRAAKSAPAAHEARRRPRGGRHGRA
jgi:hypothetical protein